MSYYTLWINGRCADHDDDLDMAKDKAIRLADNERADCEIIGPLGMVELIEPKDPLLITLRDIASTRVQ